MIQRISKDKSYLEPRLDKLLKIISKKEISGLIVLKDENIFYLTGFYGKNSNSILLLINGDLYLLVDFIYYEKAVKTLLDMRINIIKCSGDKNFKLMEIIKNYDVKLIGIESNNISYADFLELKNILNSKNIKIKGFKNMIEKLRIIKDYIEISKIRKASNVNDKVFNFLINLDSSYYKALTELKLKMEIEKKMIEYGADGSSFDMVVANNKNSSMPHHAPAKTRIKNGILLLDFGSISENYCSDITRTIFINNNNHRIKNIYDIVLQSQLKAIEYCREGISCSELDNTARNFISSKGYGEFFGHGLGHGVGLEIHEKPKINWRNNFILKKNMVITIEPAIYIEGVGGVRIEDTVIVKEHSCEVINSSVKLYTNLG